MIHLGLHIFEHLCGHIVKMQHCFSYICFKQKIIKFKHQMTPRFIIFYIQLCTENKAKHRIQVSIFQKTRHEEI